MHAKEMIEGLLVVGLTEDQIARFVEESPNGIRNIRAGKINHPSFNTVKNLRRFHTMISDLHRDKVKIKEEKEAEEK
jgi:hypothetical protein